MFFLVYLLVALVFSTLKRASSPAMYRWFDVLFLFQAAAASGLVHVNYPSNYLNFTLNFAWALGLFRSDSIENAINRLRGRTGGKLSDQAFPAVDYINRKLSPYNDFLAMEDVVASESPVSYIKSYLAERPASNVTMRTLGLTSRAIIPTVSEQDTTSQLSTGVQVYLNSLGIATANGFDTIFLVYLIAIAVAIGAHLLFFGVVLLVDMLQRSDGKGTGWAGRLRTRYLTFCAGNALRLVSLLCPWFNDHVADPRDSPIVPYLPVSCPYLRVLPVQNRPQRLVAFHPSSGPVHYLDPRPIIRHLRSVNHSRKPRSR